MIAPLVTWLLLVHISVHTMKKRLCFFHSICTKSSSKKTPSYHYTLKKHKSANDFYQSSHTWNKQLPMDLLCYGLQQKLLRNLMFLGIIVLQLIFVPAVFTSREAVRLLLNVIKIYFLTLEGMDGCFLLILIYNLTLPKRAKRKCHAVSRWTHFVPMNMTYR